MFLATQGSTPASQPAGGQRALRSLRPRPVIDFPDGGRAGRAIYGRCGTRKSGGPAGSGRRRRNSSKTRGGRLVGHTTRGFGPRRSSAAGHAHAPTEATTLAPTHRSPPVFTAFSEFIASAPKKTREMMITLTTGPRTNAGRVFICISTPA